MGRVYVSNILSGRVREELTSWAGTRRKGGDGGVRGARGVGRWATVNGEAGDGVRRWAVVDRRAQQQSG